MKLFYLWEVIQKYGDGILKSFLFQNFKRFVDSWLIKIIKWWCLDDFLNEIILAKYGVVEVQQPLDWPNLASFDILLFTKVKILLSTKISILKKIHISSIFYFYFGMWHKFIKLLCSTIQFYKLHRKNTIETENSKINKHMYWEFM